MNTEGLINIIVDQESPTQNRIDAMSELGIVLLREKEQRRGGTIDHLGEELGPLGQEALRQIIQHQGDQLEVRCHAAAMAAKMDPKSALEWCNEMVQQHC